MTKKYKPNFGPDGDMIIYHNSFTQDFSIFPPVAMKLRGIYHTPSKKSVVYPIYHENIEDIIDTCIHESIHHALVTTDFDLEDDIYKIDEEEEHLLIRHIMWAEEEDFDRPNYAVRENI